MVTFLYTMPILCKKTLTSHPKVPPRSNIYCKTSRNAGWVKSYLTFCWEGSTFTLPSTYFPFFWSQWSLTTLISTDAGRGISGPFYLQSATHSFTNPKSPHTPHRQVEQRTFSLSFLSLDFHLRFVTGTPLSNRNKGNIGPFYLNAFETGYNVAGY